MTQFISFDFFTCVYKMYEWIKKALKVIVIYINYFLELKFRNNQVIINDNLKIIGFNF